MTHYLDENLFEEYIVYVLYYERTDLPKSNNSKECMICHDCFFNGEFKFQDYVCSGCRDLTMLHLNLSDIITVKNVDYCCIAFNINDKAIVENVVTLNYFPECYKNKSNVL